MIDSARSIAVAGQHNASAVAACLGDGLCQIGYRCRHLAALDREDRRHVSGMGTGDLLITINLGAEPGPLTDLVSVAQGRGVRVLAIGLSPEDFGVRENDLALVMATTVRGSVQPLVPPFVFAQSLLMVLSDS